MLCPQCRRADAPSGVCPNCGPVTSATGVTIGALETVATSGPVEVFPDRPVVPPVLPVSQADSAAEKGMGTAVGASSPMAAMAGAPGGPLQPGQAFGGRYHIIRLLGAGGMGAVYQAWDDELGVAVALKVIRPEITEDPAAARDLERRFKRELLLARQVTHRNVVRIHDLGEIDRIKYITMPYVQGADLAAVLRREGRLPVARALSIARQIAQGLQAAHEVGVVHRDLKPANVMLDEDDSAVIMDFGIARSTAGGGGTMLGAVVGTLEYMSPEQAKAQPADHRADIYALGLIIYDMLVGQRHARHAESAVAELMERMQNAPPPLGSSDPTIPEPVERVVTRCLQPDPAFRYQTTRELVSDLEALSANSTPTAAVLAAGTTAGAGAKGSRVAVNRRILAAAAVIVLVAGAAGYGVLRWRGGDTTPAAAPVTTVSVAVLPFQNATANAALDWLGPSVAEILSAEIGQTRGLRLVATERVFQMLRDLRLAPRDLDAGALSRVREFSSAEILLAGRYAQFGAAVRLDVSVHRGSGAEPIALNVEARSESDIPDAVRRLAQQVRKALTVDAAPDGASRAAFAPATSSVPALKAYTEGLQFSREGNHLEALKRFRSATEADTGFALAFARLAQTYSRAGYEAEAQQAARQAVEAAEKAPAEQRYLIDAMRARTVNDNAKAIEAYEHLTRMTPDDSQVLFDLATVYEATGAYDKAGEALRRVLEGDPRHPDALFAMGRIEIRRRNPQAALDPLNRALSVAIQAGNQEAKGAVLNAVGIAYKRLNKPEEALRYYGEALEIRRTIGDLRGAAASLSELGQVQVQLERRSDARVSFAEALKIRRQIGDKRGIGNTLIELGSLETDSGRHDQALALYRESLQIQTEVGNEDYQALSLNNIGNIYLLQGRYDEALTYFERALQIREKGSATVDTADTLHNVAETLAKIGQYDKALSQYLRALELRRTAGDSRGAAIESFSMGTLFEYRGRYAAALDARREALETFRKANDPAWLGEILVGYGRTLVLLGRRDEARKTLDEAQAVARGARNVRLIALALNASGDGHFYRGDFKSARADYQGALRALAGSPYRDVELAARLNLAKADVKEGRSRAAIAPLGALNREAASLRLRLLEAESAVYLGEALAGTGDLQAAVRQLQAAVGLSGNLGLQDVAAGAHLALAGVTARSGDRASAERHRLQARQIIDEIRREAGSDTLLGRHDLQKLAAAPTSPQT